MTTIQSDFHMHCNFSSDSDSTPEDMILQAIRLNLVSICFTDHNDFNYPPENGRVDFQLDFNSYYKSIDTLRKKYSDKIKIFTGVEQGLSSEYSTQINNYDSGKLLDFIIGSSHIINGEDPYYPSYWEDRSTSSVITGYYENVLENINCCDNFDVYGHLDYIVRYAPNKDNDYNWTDYREIISCILKKLIEAGKGIEINTSGLKYGLKYPNPALPVIKLYRELGGEIITIGSDAHAPGHIAYDFGLIPDLLYAAGFDYYTVFSKRKPEFIKLNR